MVLPTPAFSVCPASVRTRVASFFLHSRNTDTCLDLALWFWVLAAPPCIVPGATSTKSLGEPVESLDTSYLACTWLASCMKRAFEHLLVVEQPTVRCHRPLVDQHLPVELRIDCLSIELMVSSWWTTAGLVQNSSCLSKG